MQGGALVCDFRVQSCRHRARAVVCLLLEYFHCRKTGGEPDECVNPTRQTRWSTSLQALAPPHVERRLRRARRLRCGRARRPHRGSPRCAWRLWNSMFDVDVAPPPHTRHIRHPRWSGTRRARAARSGVPGACALTSGGSPGDHPERNQVHKKETTKPVNPTRNKTRDLET